MGQAFHSKLYLVWPVRLPSLTHYELCLIGMKCALSSFITLNELWLTFYMCIYFMTCKGRLVSPIILNSVDLSCAFSRTAAAERDCRTAHNAANSAAHLTWTTDKLDCKTDCLIGLNCWYLINRSKLLPVRPIISLISYVEIQSEVKGRYMRFISVLTQDHYPWHCDLVYIP